jgi:hypothetical protein
MAFIPGQSSTSAKAIDGIEGPTAGSPVVLPSGFSGASQKPFAASDANLTMTLATGGLVTMTPTTTRTITLPTTDIYIGYGVTVINLSASNTININASGGGSATSVAPGSQMTVYANANNPTTPGQWNVAYGTAILNGGNTAGAALTIGTNDNFGLNFETNGTINGSINSSGAWTLGAPSGSTGEHLIQSSGGGGWTARILATNAAAPSGSSNGLLISAGITSLDTSFSVTNRAATSNYGNCNGVGTWSFGTRSNQIIDYVNKSSTASSVPLFRIAPTGSGDVNAAVYIKVAVTSSITGVNNYRHVSYIAYHKVAGGAWSATNIVNVGDTAGNGSVTYVSTSATTTIDVNYNGNGTNLANINVSVEILSSYTSGAGAAITSVYTKL